MRGPELSNITIVILAFFIISVAVAQAQESDAKQVCPHKPGWAPTEEELNGLISVSAQLGMGPNLCNVNLVDANLSNVKLAGANFSNAFLGRSNLRGADLTSANLTDATLGPSDLTDANLARANLAGARLTGANLAGATLKEANLTRADVAVASLTKADLSRANLTGANLAAAVLNLAKLTGATLTRTNMSLTDLTGTDLIATNLAGADLSRAKLTGANLTGADLSGVDLTSAKMAGAYLTDANLAKATLAKAELTNAELTGANLTGATLVGADLSHAKLIRAELSDASLTGANLFGADLTSANLSGADLSDANLTGAALLHVNLKGAGLAYATLSDSIYAPASAPPDAYVAGIRGLESLAYPKGEEIGLVQLRELLQKAGLREGERQVTYAIESGKTKHALQDWRIDRQGAIEGLFRLVAFDWTTAYGLHPSRALSLLLGFWLLSIPVYWWSIRDRSRAMDDRAGIYRIWPKERIEVHNSHPGLIADIKIERLRGGKLDALGWAMWYSLLSAFHLGFREFNVGNWISRLHPRQFALEATGWVRTMSGCQSLLSLYLLAIWVLTYFGRPFP